MKKGEIASGCSYGNGGLIVPSHSVPLASPGALGDGLRWLLDAESPFYIKPRLDVEVLDQVQVHELEPAFQPQVAGGVFYPCDGHIDPARFNVVVNPLGHALRIAGTLELAGMDFSYHARRVSAVHRSGDAYLRGLRPCTPDGLPIISRSSEFGNLIVAAGHAMLGMSLGPITGKLVSQLVTGVKTDINVNPLHINRF